MNYYMAHIFNCKNFFKNFMSHSFHKNIKNLRFHQPVFKKEKSSFFKNFFILILKISEEKSVCYFESSDTLLWIFYFSHCRMRSSIWSYTVIYAMISTWCAYIVIFATKSPGLSSAFSNFTNAEPDVKLKSPNWQPESGLRWNRAE